MDILDRLIQKLCLESGQRPLSVSEDKKDDYFRALCNVRPPLPADGEFISLQNKYLSALNKKRGVADIADFKFNKGLCLWQGDITRLNADAIVNACNCKLLGCFVPLHNCVDNCIHSFAGVQVRIDCDKIMRGGDEECGKVKVTSAYNLPSKYIFHTVGPAVRERVTKRDEELLSSCYLSCLDKAAEMRLGSIAFCCISTGVYGYPKEEACAVAVNTVRSWQRKNNSDLKIIFNVFTDVDREIYEKRLNIKT